ncbi:18841_t:CDS:2, partial [Racocetra persica]
ACSTIVPDPQHIPHFLLYFFNIINSKVDGSLSVDDWSQFLAPTRRPLFWVFLVETIGVAESTNVDENRQSVNICYYHEIFELYKNKTLSTQDVVILPMKLEIKRLE